MSEPTLQRALDVLREHGRADLAEAVEEARRQAHARGYREGQEALLALLEKRAADLHGGTSGEPTYDPAGLMALTEAIEAIRNLPTEESPHE